MELGLKNYTDFRVKTTQRIKGSYGFRVILKYEDGSSRTQQCAGFDSFEASEAARDLAKVDLRRRTYLVYGSILFKDYVRHWLEDDIRKRVKSYNTYYSYKSVAEKHLIPLLGNKRMKEINSADIMRLYNHLYPVSKSVAKQAKVVVNTCLTFAISERAVATNVAAGVSLPKSNEKEQHGYHSRELDSKKTLTHEQVMTLIEGSKDSPIHIMILFNVVMGLRCSEIIGLKYSDVDFVNQKLNVARQLGRDITKDDSELAPKTLTKQEQKPKTYSSIRTLDIPDIVYDAILQQRKHYKKCQSRRKASFLDLGYICCSSYGRPRSKNYHFKEFKRLLRELGLPDVRWHDLRSTCATQLLLGGISTKAVAKTLGHAKEIVTVKNYIDNSKITVVKLDRLDSYIESVVPKEKDGSNDFSDVKIDISEYIPI